MTDQTVTVHKTNITNKASRPPVRPEPEGRYIRHTPPTDPYVHTLAHTVPLMMDSPYSKLYARIAILGRDGDT